LNDIDETWINNFKKRLDELTCDQLQELLIILRKTFDDIQKGKPILPGESSTAFRHSTLTKKYIGYIIGYSKDFCDLAEKRDYKTK